MANYLPFFLCLLSLNLAGQVADTMQTLRLQSVTVTAYKEEPLHETALLIVPLKVDSLSRYGNFNLASACLLPA